MPGLLGYLGGEPLSADPTKADAADGALWQLAAGLLSGRGPAGPTIGNAVGGAMGTYRGLLADALKKQYVESQIGENTSQADARKQQMAMALRDQQMRDQFLQSLGVGGQQPGAAPAGGMTPPGLGMSPTAMQTGMSPGPAAPAPQARPDRFSGVPNDAAAADLLFNKGTGLGGMIAKGAEPNVQYQSGVPVDMKGKNLPIIPQVERNGMGYTLAPDGKGGFAVQPATGSVDAFTAFKDAENRSQAGYKTQPVTGPDGRARMMTEAQIADQARGGPPAVIQPPGAPQTPPQVPTGQSATATPAPPEFQRQYEDALMGMGKGTPAEQEVARQKVANYERFAQQSGFNLMQGDRPVTTPTVNGPMRGRAAPIMPNAQPGMEVQSPAATAGAKTLAEGQAGRVVDREKSIANGGIQAANSLAQISRAEQLFSGLDGGKLTPIAQDVASMAASLGVKIDPKWSSAEAASALAEKMANQMKPAGSGAVSDADLASFQRQVPTLSKTPEGRRQIFSTMRAFAERETRVAQMARDYRGLKGSLDDDFESRLQGWIERNPLKF